MTAVLEREVARERTQADEVRANLYSSILGYKEVQKDITRSRVVQLLRQIEMAPFTQASVNAYKKEKVGDSDKTVVDSLFMSAWGATRLVRGWVRTELKKCNDAVPVDVLDRALIVTGHLKKHGVDHTWHVESLVESRQVLDPFLLFVVPGVGEFYVDVWDEPGFDRKRDYA